MLSSRFALSGLLTLVTLCPVAAQSEPQQKATHPAPLFKRLGDHHHSISTKSKLAQRYFDQGLTLAYGFNHKEAIRSFEAVAKLDPQCAMAYWGIAWVLGPNINAPMTDEAVPQAWQALQKAKDLAGKASKKEQAYVSALAKRYAPKPMKDRSKLDVAFADAMREVVKQYPDDLDAATICAEAMMDTTPWAYWEEDGKPKDITKEIVEQLERVLKANPDHPGANHYYIHAVEASPNPERALGAAHRLRFLVPDAGHLVHMPSHVYLRLGMYHEGALVNERAIAADESYITQCRAQGFYPTIYYSHNVHFLWYVTSLEGRSDVCIESGRKTAAVLSEKDVKAFPFLQWLKATPWFALARFGQWEVILKEKQPKKENVFEMAMWHYVRGLAFARQRKLDTAEKELRALRTIADSEDAKKMEMAEFPGLSVMRIATGTLQAEVAGLRGDSDERIRLLEKAVEQQDALSYMEPPFWHFPVRQLLGRALLEAGMPAKAESVYRADLKDRPANGWSTFGLLQSLRAQGKTEEATEVQKDFREAWKHADVVLTSSCF